MNFEGIPILKNHDQSKIIGQCSIEKGEVIIEFFDYQTREQFFNYLSPGIKIDDYIVCGKGEIKFKKARLMCLGGSAK